MAVHLNGNAPVVVIDTVGDRTVYQRSIEFLTLAHRVRGQLQRGNADLADQLRRAAQSIPQNIAEGAGRSTRADKAKHYTIARGSAMECAAHLDVMRVGELVAEADYTLGVDLIERVVAMLAKRLDFRAARSNTVPITTTGAFPFRCTATITGSVTSTPPSTLPFRAPAAYRS